MTCPAISNIRFSKSSKEAIEDIQRIQELGDLLTSVVAGSTVVKIFLGRSVGALEVAYNISSYEWSAWAQAMGAISKIKKGRVQRIAYTHLLDNQTTLTVEEVKFWEAVVYGCH